MKGITATPAGGWRIAAVTVAALLILLPAAWVVWSLSAAALAAETVRSQSAQLAQFQSRLATLQPQSEQGARALDTAIFLPGETVAIAGAALQRRVADAIAAAGGRVIETEFARVETAEEDPGRVDLRVSFDADIVSLQGILLDIEAGLPILLVRSIDIQTAAEATEAASPPLRVTMLVGGYREAAD